MGTGRVAIPLIESGVELIGLDLSPAMLRRYRTKAGARRTPGVCADLVALPFREASFAAVLGVHVFHLVGRWRDGLAEVKRVLAPGGRLLHSWHRASHGSLEPEIREALGEIARRHGASVERPGARDAAEVVRALADRGAGTRTVEIASWTSSTTPRTLLHQLRAGLFTYTWSMEPRIAAACVDELERWATRRYRSLDAVERFRETFELHVHDFRDVERSLFSGAEGRLADARAS